MGKKNTSLGCFFWLAFILLIALLFFINKDNIARVFEKTNAISIFQKKETQEEKQNEVDLEGIQNEIEKIRAAEKDEENSSEGKAEAEPEKPAEQVQKTVKKNSEPQKTTAEDRPKEEKKTKTETQTVKKNSESKNKDESKKDVAKLEQKNEKASEKRSSKIYLVKIDSDGKLVRKPVMRQLEKTDSPLTDAINSLLQGPTTEEAKQGFRSFIPPDTKLLSIEVKNGVAEVNISEDFQFNRYGIEAYQAQLEQIVFTACEFSTVSSVQFLIKGKKKEYLGAEGIWIGSPLSVNSFIR
ncbi:GerMN domain-containing protein [Treponema denticola]|uniref:GerMN domain-containing protein n=1 Tax=Treponema denticola TaxID=158 RepID=UPI0021F8CA5D|nr:GerMN domain-containing protein [Treponema denticola]UYT08639.1 GerMN domain-containing protein [Treponema denticola]